MCGTGFLAIRSSNCFKYVCHELYCHRGIPYDAVKWWAWFLLGTGRKLTMKQNDSQNEYFKVVTSGSSIQAQYQASQGTVSCLHADYHWSRKLILRMRRKGASILLVQILVDRLHNSVSIQVCMLVIFMSVCCDRDIRECGWVNCL